MKCPILPKVPLAPMQNGTYTVHVNSLPMGYSVLQSQTPTTGQLHVDPMGCGLSCGHVMAVSSASAASSNHHQHQGTAIVMDITEEAPSVPQCNAMVSMSEMAVSSASAASSNHFPFTPSEIPTGMDASVLDTTFTSDV
ncbi:unnamed protein product [Musa acuminata subsp. burmannicoides]